MTETLEQAAKKYSGIMYDRENNEEKYFNGQGCDRYDAFLEGAKWQSERMYSEEDLRYAFECATDLNPSFESFNVWFEQFKKK